MGPAAHLGLTILVAAAVILLDAPGALLLVALLGASVARIVLYTIVAIGREAEPLKTLTAFLYLPFYTVWRVGVQVSSLAMLGERPWVRTERND